MTISTPKRALCLAIGLTFTAALLFASAAGGTTSTPEVSGHPTFNGRGFQCDPESGQYRVSFSWTRQMPGNGAWLGTVTVRQGNNVVLNNKPIQVFDATPPNASGTDLVHRQFQAQDGSFYCSDLSIQPPGQNVRNSVSFSGCRNWLLADQACAFPRF